MPFRLPKKVSLPLFPSKILKNSTDGKDKLIAITDWK